MLEIFYGEGDVIAWHLVARLQEITDIACLIALYLKGDTLALYLEMTEEEEHNVDIRALRLKEALTNGPFVAYAKLDTVWYGL